MEPLPELQTLARPDAPCRLCEDLPARITQGLEEQYLDLAAGRPAATETCRDDPRVVEDETVPWPQVLGQVGEAAVFPAALGAMQDHHATGCALGQWLLSNKLLRQVVVKIGHPHGAQRLPRNGRACPPDLVGLTGLGCRQARKAGRTPAAPPAKETAEGVAQYPARPAEAEEAQSVAREEEAAVVAPDASGRTP